MFFLTSKKEKIEVRDTEFQEGGQAAVYFPRSHPGSVIKVYKKKPNRDDIDKLKYMIANPPQDSTRVEGHRSFAWPADLAYDAYYNVVGYIMPRIPKCAPLLDVFNPHRRRVLKLQLNWYFLFGVAANLASAVASLHEKNYILGDLNEANVLVNNRALVTLIDTDSFQVQVGQRVYPCPVGKEEYTPREVLANGLKGRRETCSDTFALAVLIHQLVLEGNHPFRGVWKGTGDPPAIAEKIRLGYFPYAAGSPNRPLIGPRPTLGDLPPAVQHNFMRAFIEGHLNPRERPTAAEWQKTLRAAMNELRPCPAHPGHFYFPAIAPCPWCARTGKSKTPAPAPRPYTRETARPSQAQAHPTAKPTTPTTLPAAKPVITPPPQPKTQPATSQPSTALKLSKSLLDFGQRFTGASGGAGRKITITNPGGQAVRVSLLASVKWLEFTENQFAIRPGETKEFKVKLLAEKVDGGTGPKTAAILVRRHDGGSPQVIKVKVDMLATDVRLSQTGCVFTAAHRHQTLMQEVRVKNHSAKSLTVRLSSPQKWVSLSPKSLKLDPGRAEIFRVIVTPAAAKVKDGQTVLTGEVVVKGPGAFKKGLKVTLNLKK